MALGGVEGAAGASSALDDSEVLLLEKAAAAAAAAAAADDGRQPRDPGMLRSVNGKDGRKKKNHSVKTAERLRSV